ncbi:hypothetical protein BDW62DRAFT_200468 [Aspergillus aurantiobrunneus]
MSGTSLEEEIVSLTRTANSTRETLDEATRIKALKAARGLVEALSSPVETAVQAVSLSFAVPFALRMGVQLGVFKAIRDHDHNHQGQGITTDEIAGRSGASPLVVEQVLRVLSATGHVLETGMQLYKPSALTIVMADPIMEATTRATFDIGHPCVTYGPEYFRRNGNQFPTSVTDTPFQLANNTNLSYFDWLGENPSLAQDFQQSMTIKQQKTPCWVDWFDVEGVILDGFQDMDMDEAILLVDIGGGEGHYTHAFNRKFPHAPGRRIIQDLPHVISSITSPPDLPIC